MTRIKKIIVLAELLFLCGCSAGITRYGYEPPSLVNAEHKLPCHVSINNNLKYARNDIEVVGGIKAYDTLFSIYCDEAYVLDIFHKEACALGSNIINITEENYPDALSTCYRANAEFLRFKDNVNIGLIESHPKYARKLIIERSQVTSQKNKSAAMNLLFAGMLGGTLGGFGMIVPH